MPAQPADEPGRADLWEIESLCVVIRGRARSLQRLASTGAPGAGRMGGGGGGLGPLGALEDLDELRQALRALVSDVVR